MILKDNHIDDDMLKSVVEHLETSNIYRLDLRSNKITSVGVKMI